MQTSVITHALEETPPFDPLRTPTVSVPAWGKYAFGLGRNASYLAAKNGRFPTLRLGAGRIVVPVAIALRQLGIESSPAGEHASAQGHIPVSAGV